MKKIDGYYQLEKDLDISEKDINTQELPGLGRLIEALGTTFRCLKYNRLESVWKWSASGTIQQIAVVEYNEFVISENGKTPEEACARLYIKLKKSI